MSYRALRALHVTSHIVCPCLENLDHEGVETSRSRTISNYDLRTLVYKRFFTSRIRYLSESVLRLAQNITRDFRTFKAYKLSVFFFQRLYITLHFFQRSIIAQNKFEICSCFNTDHYKFIMPLSLAFYC